MTKSIYAIAAALVAAAIVCLPSLSPQVQASAPTFGIKGDRVDARALGAACSHREWPYYEAACLRDAKYPFGEARQVRLVSADRLP
jgi:hypothetical protein